MLVYISTAHKLRSCCATCSNDLSRQHSHILITVSWNQNWKWSWLQRFNLHIPGSQVLSGKTAVWLVTKRKWLETFLLGCVWVSDKKRRAEEVVELSHHSGSAHIAAPCRHCCSHPTCTQPQWCRASCMTGWSQRRSEGKDVKSGESHHF